MSKEKQIEEMAKVIEEASCGYGVDGCHRCEFDGKEDFSCAETRIAKALYNAGYRKQSEWISVDERLPEVGESVLGYAESMEECFVVAYSNTYRTFFCGQFPNDDITHWMPLPEPPKKGGEE